MTLKNIDWPQHEIGEFCRRWKIAELSVFGSVTGDNFKPSSDVDVLYTFRGDAQWSLLDLIEAEDELSHILERKVDLVSRKAVESSRNWIRRQAILSSAECVYAEPE
jgi:uncharacterized protein